jgi:hypothetical protein
MWQNHVAVIKYRKIVTKISKALAKLQQREYIGSLVKRMFLGTSGG